MSRRDRDEKPPEAPQAPQAPPPDPPEGDQPQAPDPPQPTEPPPDPPEPPPEEPKKVPDGYVLLEAPDGTTSCAAGGSSYAVEDGEAIVRQEHARALIVHCGFKEV
jgi:hypothetical protein